MGLVTSAGSSGNYPSKHVPPEAAFNNRPVENPDIMRLMGTSDLDAMERVRGRQSQRGAGGHTLCLKCNPTTGHWYGSAYVDWAVQGLELLRASGGSPTLYHAFHIFPLRVIKQLVTMFFSANGPNFRETHQSLVRFVRDRNEKYLSPAVRVYAFYTMSNRSRQAGVTGLVKFSDDWLSAQAKFFSEITFPPFGYVLAINSQPPDRDMFDISFFANYRYGDRTDVQLRLPAKSTYSWLPGDYRSREEIGKALATSRHEPDSDRGDPAIGSRRSRARAGPRRSK